MADDSEPVRFPHKEFQQLTHDQQHGVADLIHVAHAIERLAPHREAIHDILRLFHGVSRDVREAWLSNLSGSKPSQDD